MVGRCCAKWSAKLWNGGGRFLGMGGNVRQTLLGLGDGSSCKMFVLSLADHTQLHEQCQLMTKRANPDLDQGPAALQSAALTTELCTLCHGSALSFLGQLWRASRQASRQPAGSQQSTFLMRGKKQCVGGPAGLRDHFELVLPILCLAKCIWAVVVCYLSRNGSCTNMYWRPNKNEA